MSEVQSPAQPGRPPRRRELDFLRGVALIVMTLGHPLRTDILRPGVDIVRANFNIYGELFSAFFMFMSAVNVTNFIESAKRNPRLDPTRFYIRSSLALFVLGTSYNLCVRTLPVIDIIQSVAIGTLAVYLLLRLRVSTWGFALISIAFFAAGFLIVGPNPLTDATFGRVGPLGYLVKHFGPIPWVGFFTYGIFIDRIPRGKWEIPAMIFFLAVFAAGHLLPPVQGTFPATILFKANPRYVVMACGLLPAIFLAGRRWYRGDWGPLRVLESWGVESLIFLVYHWAIIYLMMPFMVMTALRANETVAVWSVSIITLLSMWRLVPLIVEKRDKWFGHPDYGRKSRRIFITGTAGWALTLALAAAFALSGHVPLAAVARFASMVFAFIAGFSFCFFYPYVRIQIRQTSMRKIEPASS